MIEVPEDVNLLKRPEKYAPWLKRLIDPRDKKKNLTPTLSLVWLMIWSIPLFVVKFGCYGGIKEDYLVRRDHCRANSGSYSVDGLQ